MEISGLVIIVFLGLVLLRGVLIAVGAALIVRPVIRCPACFEDTVALRRRWLQRLMPWLEWRWCPHCGWAGPARRLK